MEGVGRGLVEVAGWLVERERAAQFQERDPQAGLLAARRGGERLLRLRSS